MYLQALAEELGSRRIGKPVQLLLVGGAYMLYFVRNRSVTKDVDVVPVSFPDTMNADKETKAFRSAANAVARRFGLRRDWVNDVVAAFAPEPGPTTLWRDYGALQIYVPDAAYILALKLLSGRDRDADDIEALCEMLHIETREQAQELVDRYADSAWQYECNLQATLDDLF
ncbi:hypothetical protein EI42_02265 [Thermosporothrix hazakensis]|uniref:Nucleotidyltransferase AbiEii toxin of type IV toxin-antitoxin system n=3 Tax=Thermosporothrix TaxID=768650 RepID=A0A326U7W9_THEHA|nr:hypothetical protein EI42_02265 [Thermosporothrix hazakensis]BBH86611.1 hypothetical protein KTC_13620 [Thermosporothrix sp. COM3]GCE50921.1 hypothetical protein KTH_57900 [Thermosporothrix hazakensis]